MRRISFVWFAALLVVSTFVSSPATAVATLTTNSNATVSSFGVNYDSEIDNSPPLGNVSAAAAGTNTLGQPFDGTASAFVDASEYTDLTRARFRMSGATSMTGRGQSSAASRVIVTDTWTFEDPASDGQVGSATFQLLVEGSADASLSNVLMDLFVYSSTGGVTTQAFRDSYHLTNLGSEFCTLAGETGGGPGCFDLFAFSFPFTWGTDVTFRIDWFTRATTALNPGQTGSANYDFDNSLYWGGLTAITASGNAVTNYTFNADSGFNWIASSIPTNSVPEPTTLVLLGLGLAGLAFARRKQ